MSPPRLANRSRFSPSIVILQSGDRTLGRPLVDKDHRWSFPRHANVPFVPASAFPQRTDTGPSHESTKAWCWTITLRCSRETLTTRRAGSVSSPQLRFTLAPPVGKLCRLLLILIRSYRRRGGSTADCSNRTEKEGEMNSSWGFGLKQWPKPITASLLNASVPASAVNRDGRERQPFAGAQVTLRPMCRRVLCISWKAVAWLPEESIRTSVPRLLEQRSQMRVA